MNKLLSKSFSKLGMLLSLSLVLTCFTACEDDVDFGSKPISVTSIHLSDADDTVIDREITFARLGALIRINGSGFTGMRKVYINGFETYFNPVYVTDNSMIIRINRDTPTFEADENVRNTIRLVKTGTELVYDFNIRAAAPVITRISHTLPQAGELITIHGTGLQNVSSITFPGNIIVTSGIVSDEDGRFCVVTVPSGITGSGSVLVESDNGKAYSYNYFNFHQGIINDFDNRNTHSWGSGISDNLSTVIPATGNAPRSRGNYRSLNPGGTTNFGTGPKQSFSWAKSNRWREFVTEDVIPATTPATEMAFQFDLYVATAWDMGSVHVVILDEFPTDALYEYNFAPWVDRTVGARRGTFRTDGWFTVSIPLNEFPAYSTEGTFQTLLNKEATAVHNQYGIFFNNTVLDGIEPVRTNVEIFYDNFRFVPLTKPAVSDYE